MIATTVLFVLSIAVLVFASDKFISAAETVGRSYGISSFIIGVTILAFGTSLPELATSIFAVVDGSSEIVLGNVVGSNITNILLVLGISVVSTKVLRMDYDVMDVDMPLLFLSAFLLWFSLRDGTFSMFEALLFIVALIVFLVNSIKNSPKEDVERPTAAMRDYITLLLCGILVYFGAEYTVKSLSTIATDLGVPKAIVSVTALSLGTSLPEVVVSISATRRGQHSMAIGNILGSNIFNTYAVMAIPSFFGGLVISKEMMDFHVPFMLVVTALLGIICLSKKISRWEGVMLLIFYAFFLGESVKSGIL